MIYYAGGQGDIKYVMFFFIIKGLFYITLVLAGAYSNSAQAILDKNV